MPLPANLNQLFAKGLGIGHRFYSMTDPTHIKRSGTIIQSLNATSIGVLLFTIDDRITYQTEMSERLDCTPAPITTTLQTLEELEIPFVEKQRQYEITPAGGTAIGIIDECMLKFGIDLCEVDWSNDDEKEHITNTLKPLCNSRSMRPFFVLDVLYTNDNDDITIDGIVTTIQDTTDNNPISRRHVKRTLERFEINDCVEISDESITLTEHGSNQGHMLQEFIYFSTMQGNESINPSIDEPEENLNPIPTEIIPAYKSCDDTVQCAMTFPQTTTVDSFYKQVKSLWEKHDTDEELKLVWLQHSVTT